MDAGRRAYGVRWPRLAVVVVALVALNAAALALSSVAPVRGVPGLDLVAIVVNAPAEQFQPSAPAGPPVSAPIAGPAAMPPTGGITPVVTGDRGQPRPGQSGVRGIVFSPDGRTGWQFPRRPPEDGRGQPGGPPPGPPSTTIIRPLAISRPGLDGGSLYLATLAATVGSGFVLLLLFPQRLGLMSSAMTSSPLRLLRLLAIGVVAYVGAAALALLLVLVVTGIPLAAALVVALSVATVLGVVAVALAIGERLTTWVRLRDRRSVVDFLVGMLVLVPLAALPLFGWAITVLTAAIGFGAILLTRFGSEPPGAPALTPPGFDRPV
ncbi:MAG: hypothetical protein U0556_01790 [Dehalococcoidia bacterium]